MKRIRFILFALLLLAACKRNNPLTEGTYVAFGTAYGECLGDCAKFWLLKEDKLYADDMDYLVWPMRFRSPALSTEKAAIARDLFDSFPPYLLDRPNVTIGCPDCADQGGIHIEIGEVLENQEEVITRWHIDMDTAKQPDTLRTWIRRMIETTGQLE